MSDHLIDFFCVSFSHKEAVEMIKCIKSGYLRIRDTKFQICSLNILCRHLCSRLLTNKKNKGKNKKIQKCLRGQTDKLKTFYSMGLIFRKKQANVFVKLIFTEGAERFAFFYLPGRLLKTLPLHGWICRYDSFDQQGTFWGGGYAKVNIYQLQSNFPNQKLNLFAFF